MIGYIVITLICTFVIIIFNLITIGVCAGQIGAKVGEMLKEYLKKWLNEYHDKK